jgi:tRNA modification GTPase
VQLNDTIAAISSAAGPSARMIVRASGPEAERILDRICRGGQSKPSASRVYLELRGLRVPGWAYRFASGRSYTGDELIELHIPGNPLLARMVLDHLLDAGARLAEPGEFTARAFFNGRMDLAQAEGVAAVVGAQNQAQLDAGRRLMAGELSNRLRPTMDKLAHLLALVEAEIDFSDEETRFLPSDQRMARLGELDVALADLLGNSARFSRLSNEPRIVLAGRPNAGKSTLLNALAAADRAVVSPTAGTTRDALSAAVVLDRGIVHLVDVAGLEEGATTDSIQMQMRDRARQELERADAVVYVRDVADGRPMLELGRAANLVVLTKIDLHASAEAQANAIAISAVTGSGMDRLRASLEALAFGHESSGTASELALTGRHVDAIGMARKALAQAREQEASELIAADLRAALDWLGQVCGDVSPDDILGKIFSTFCIGK